MTNIWYSLAAPMCVFRSRPTTSSCTRSCPQPALASGDITATLGRVPLLAPLAEDDVQRVRPAHGGFSSHATRRSYAKVSPELVLRHRARRGARAPRASNGGGGRVIARLGPGDFFGEMSLLAGDPRSATVLAEEDTAVVEVGRDAFQQIVASNPAVLEPISDIAMRRMSAQQELRARRASAGRNRARLYSAAAAATNSSFLRTLKHAAHCAAAGLRLSIKGPHDAPIGVEHLPRDSRRAMQQFSITHCRGVEREAFRYRRHDAFESAPRLVPRRAPSSVSPRETRVHVERGV